MALGKYELSEDAKARFWGRVHKSDNGCWLWRGSVNSAKRQQGGYGKFHCNGKHLRSHIVSWVLAHGAAPPDGMFIGHKCDNRRCVNPAHLDIMSPAENVRDMISKGRAHSMVHLSERQCSALADEIGIELKDLAVALNNVLSKPTRKWPYGLPNKLRPRIILTGMYSVQN